MFEPDLIFSSKFSGFTRSTGLEFRIFADPNDFVTSAQHGAEALIINLDTFGSQNLQHAVKIGVPIMGYYSHVNSDVAQIAVRLGVNLVVTRGTFVTRPESLISELLRTTRKVL